MAITGHETEPNGDPFIGLCKDRKVSTRLRKPFCGECQCGEQHKGVAKMQTQKGSVSGGSVQAFRLVEQDEQCAKQGFVEQQRCCRYSRVARPLAHCGAPPAPN
jgi:hypothetical protein